MMFRSASTMSVGAVCLHIREVGAAYSPLEPSKAPGRGYGTEFDRGAGKLKVGYDTRSCLERHFC